MKTQLNTVEMNLTARQIKLIAFEAEGVDTFAPDMMSEFSKRAQGFMFMANANPSYVARRCYFLINGKKLS